VGGAAAAADKDHPEACYYLAMVYRGLQDLPAMRPRLVRHYPRPLLAPRAPASARTVCALLLCLCFLRRAAPSGRA